MAGAAGDRAGGRWRLAWVWCWWVAAALAAGAVLGAANSVLLRAAERSFWGTALAVLGALLLTGLAAGCAQWAVLRRVVPDVRWWVPATIAGTVVGYLVMAATNIALALWLLPAAPGRAAVAPGWLLVAYAGVNALGPAVAQWVLLRRRLARAWAWLVVVPVAAMATEALHASPGGPYDPRRLGVAEAATVAGLGAAETAAITGLVLVGMIGASRRVGGGAVRWGWRRRQGDDGCRAPRDDRRVVAAADSRVAGRR